MKTKRELLDSYLTGKYKKSLKTIFAKIDKCEYVSFDIYDTLIKRIVPKPEDVFTLVEKIYNEKYAKDVQINNFKEIRQAAQALAKKTTHLEEITLNDIYGKLEGISEQNKSILMHIEEDVEENCVLFNYEIKDIWKYCVQKKKKIICISDMYLSRNLIQKILKKCGITEFEKLYVSSDVKLKKSTGRLYKYAIKDLGIKASSICHIGDNLKGDFISAYRQKIHSILLPRESKNIFYWGNYDQHNFDQRLLRSFINVNVRKIDNNCERLGYEVLGVLLLGFCQWLKDKSQADRKLFFLARDAHIIKKAYEMLYPDERDRICYLYVSRKSVIRPYLCDFNHAEELWRLYSDKEGKVSYREVWSDLGFEEPDIVFEWDKKICKNEFICGNFKEIIEKYLEKERKKTKKEKELLLEYFKQENVSGNVGFVDLGWKGTIPFCVERMYGQNKIEINLHNYFFGYEHVSDRELKNTIFAYLFHTYMEGRNQMKIQMYLFELFFLEPSGSTVGYQKQSDRMIPIKNENENIGAVENIKLIHKGALTFIKDYTKYANLCQVQVKKEIAFSPFLNFSQSPMLEDVKSFGQMQYLSVKQFCIFPKHERIWYLGRPGKLLKEFSESAWKVGFLKFFFQIPLPYFKIYQFLEKTKRLVDKTTSERSQ